MDLVIAFLVTLLFIGFGLAAIGRAVDRNAEMLRREVRAAVAEALEHRQS